MKTRRSCFLAVMAGLASVVVAHTPAISQTSAASSLLETSKTTNIKNWTRERLAAAKKRWAEDNAKFSDCASQLKNQQKAKRLSLHRQGHFLQDCMNRIR
jgi:hypothetical protein